MFSHCLDLLSLSSKDSVTFFLNALRKNDDGLFHFYFFGKWLNPITDQYYSLLKFPNHDNDYNTSFQCLAGKLSSTSKFITVYPVDCSSRVSNAYFCQQRHYECVQNTLGVVEQMDLLFDPVFQDDQENQITRKTNQIQGIMNYFDPSKSYQTLFSSLWHTSLPCFDLEGQTSFSDKERSILKFCEWKGLEIPCSKIFVSFPTDIGICCSFNMRAADEILVGDTYTNVINQLQSQDYVLTFNKGKLPLNYIENQEPKTETGKIKGLNVILDAHSDLFSGGSANGDTNGFFGLIHPKGSFPLIAAGGFDIRPGHNNLVSISATVVNTDDSIRNLDPIVRNCRFSDENENLLLYKNYTQANCLLECSFSFAQKTQKLKNSHYNDCIPWFFPTAEEFPVICDSWQAVELFNLMTSVAKSDCTQCLPDCSTTIYKKSISAASFRECFLDSIGVSKACNYKNVLNQSFKMRSNIVLDNYKARFDKIPSHFKSLFKDANRSYSSTLKNGDIFGRNNIGYNPYEHDIAKVQIYFKTPVVIEIRQQATMTWIEYFSNVGGILGLFLGIGFIFLFEFFWLFMNILNF